MLHRSGYRSSEFWVTFVSFIFSGLYLIGIIGESSYKDELIRDVSHAVESVILISGQIFIVYNYIKSRQTVKEAALKITKTVTKPVKKTSPKTTKTQAKKDKQNESKSRNPKSTTNKPRTSINRSRKTNTDN